MAYDEHNKLIVLNCLKFYTLYLESGIEKAEVMLTALVLSGVMYHHYRWSGEKIVDVTIQTIHELFPDYKTLDDKWFNRHVFSAK